MKWPSFSILHNRNQLLIKKRSDLEEAREQERIAARKFIATLIALENGNVVADRNTGAEYVSAKASVDNLEKK